jgi:rhodanese-related sulfurtransferase
MLNKYLKMLAVLMALVFVVSCSDDDNSNDPVQMESEILAQYIESTTDYVNTNAPAMINASEVKQLMATGDVYVMDIRAAEDYAKGHIEGAVNVTIPNVLEHIKTVNFDDYQKVAVVCYSGQSASWTTSLLRLLGYDNVYTMKFGMCSWSTETMVSWPNNISNSHATQFVTEATEKPAAGEMPTLATGYTDGAKILEARVAAVFAEGFGAAATNKTTVFGDLDKYHIVNYWKKEHYDNPGHIPGAMQYTPKASFKMSADLKTLPADKEIVVYCYTGQTSAHMAAFLRVLGYNAKSLSFGVNGMAYDLIDGKDGFTTWHDTYCEGYDLVTD